MSHFEMNCMKRKINPAKLKTESIEPKHASLDHTNSLRKLTNDELEFRLKDLIQKERKLLHIILEHIKEVSRRELYLAKAYSSMYEYLTKEMGYSGSSAMRRLEAANLLKDLPSLAENIKNGSVNLTQVCELSRAIKEKERATHTRIPTEVKHGLLAQIASKTTAETQKILAESLDLPLQMQDKKRVQQDESVRLEITLSKEQFEKLRSSRDELIHVLSQQQKEISWANVIEVLCEKHLRKVEKHSDKIEKVSLHKVHLQQAKVVAVKKVSPHAITASATEGVADSTDMGMNADLPMPVEQRMIQPIHMSLLKSRCCQFRDPKTGRKCESTFALQVDHIIPRWAGGLDTPENLQYLCAAHNAYKYRRQAGIVRR